MKNYKKPIVSIITSSWNREKYLKKLSKSLEKLNYNNFEWVIGNDGSTDETDKFIRLMSKRAKFKIKYASSDVRIGKSKMVNYLLDNISGEYILECDSDDYFLPNSLDTLVNLIPKNKGKNFGGVCGQNLNTLGVSQTFKNKIPKETKKYRWKNLRKILQGDATILVKSDIFKNKKFLEVDFLITESSLLDKIYKNKEFILTPKIVKVMDRNSNNSVSFGNKLSYTRGSFYTLISIEKYHIFIKKKLIDKLKILIQFWRYSIHGDIGFFQAIKKFKPVRKNMFYVLIYPLSFIYVLRDILLNKVEKTHIEFEKNKKIAKIKLEKLS